MARLTLAIVCFVAACASTAQQAGNLGARQAHRVLDDFEAALDHRWSYRHASAADFGTAIARLRTRTSRGMSVDELGIELHKIIALGIDGHSGVTGYVLPGKALPFLIEPDRDRAIAFLPDRSGFLAPGLPYVIDIDGRAIRQWCEAAESIVVKGSSQYRRHRCLAGVRSIDFLRGALSLPLRASAKVTLESADGSIRRVIDVTLVDAPPPYGRWPAGGSRVLESGIGYLRLTTMVSETSLKEIAMWMPAFRNAPGLIVDVRDNAGGDRDALLSLYSYLAAPGDPPHPFTAAAYRLHDAHPRDHLAKNHRMFTRDAPEWSEPQRDALNDFIKTFRPQQPLPKGQFSDWHYMVLSRRDDPAVYFYDKPIVILMNGKSFSATDIFLAGLKGLRNVTLLGTPSAGGSAYTQEIPLGDTALRLRIGSIVSVQADGRLFDGNGITPDVIVEPAPEYYVGGSDTALHQAVRRLSVKQEMSVKSAVQMHDDILMNLDRYLRPASHHE